MRQGFFTILENKPLTASVARLRLGGDTSWITAPGQFVNIELPGLFLRRPFSVGDWDEYSVMLYYEKVGRGTELLWDLPVGTELDVLTGLGNGFDLTPAGEDPLLVGGGTGISPLLGLGRRILELGIMPHVILGFRSRKDIFALEDFRALGLHPCITTEDGTCGVSGYVTDAMELPYSYVYACGPEAMLRAVEEKSVQSGQFSFDARMGCGFGACMGCTKRTKEGPKRVCKEGPVFRKEDLLWDD